MFVKFFNIQMFDPINRIIEKKSLVTRKRSIFGRNMLWKTKNIFITCEINKKTRQLQEIGNFSLHKLNIEKNIDGVEIS